jgi:hypothetical protein
LCDVGSFFDAFDQRQPLVNEAKVKKIGQKQLFVRIMPVISGKETLDKKVLPVIKKD